MGKIHPTSKVANLFPSQNSATLKNIFPIASLQNWLGAQGGKRDQKTRFTECKIVLVNVKALARRTQAEREKYFYLLCKYIFCFFFSSSSDVCPIKPFFVPIKKHNLVPSPTLLNPHTLCEQCRYNFWMGWWLLARFEVFPSFEREVICHHHNNNASKRHRCVHTSFVRL